jgi:dihydrodipicolinate synthase/N-acetylneuraminate lyase
MRVPFVVDGVIPIIPTPFTREDTIDLYALGCLLEFAVDARVRAVCLPAYASEFYKLREAECRELVLQAISILNGRLAVVAQVNHVSPAYVAQTARELEAAGAAAINVAVPRLFALPERDLIRYFDRVLEAITVPLVIQDFNPGAPTLSHDFVKSLHKQHPHFRYLKLEEPLMAARVQAILDETDGDVGVIDGWGGTYMLELIDAGICGVMPGLGVSDLLQLIWEHARSGDKDTAYNLFQGVLPQIAYSLQSLEFFHHAEKALLVARGVLADAVVRDATMTVNKTDRQHLDFLNRRVIDHAQRQKVIP